MIQVLDTDDVLSTNNEVHTHTTYQLGYFGELPTHQLENSGELPKNFVCYIAVLQI